MAFSRSPFLASARSKGRYISNGRDQLHQLLGLGIRTGHAEGLHAVHKGVLVIAQLGQGAGLQQGRAQARRKAQAEEVQSSSPARRLHPPQPPDRRGDDLVLEVGRVTSIAALQAALVDLRVEEAQHLERHVRRAPPPQSAADRTRTGPERGSGATEERSASLADSKRRASGVWSESAAAAGAPWSLRQWTTTSASFSGANSANCAPLESSDAKQQLGGSVGEGLAHHGPCLNARSAGKSRAASSVEFDDSAGVEEFALFLLRSL
eukprot:scaffold109_cov252-Pinguiococcus_pyrenoidosus.AAC.44